ncbi:MAG: glycosyltransferase [Cyanobacteria bacterium P01_H01_bin.35]
MKIMVYSHDTYGLGNLRRILAICQILLDEIPELSILLVSSSPFVHCLRIPQRLDYIKLPCIGRNELGEISVKFLGTEIEQTLKLRSELIKITTIIFQPDIILVDKKPYGLEGELKDTLENIQNLNVLPKLVLLLRDILDTPKRTIREWENNQYYQGIERFYDRVLVVGTPDIFDMTKKYNFPASISKKVKFCGYLNCKKVNKNSQELRQELNISSDEKFILVTVGGGADGYDLINTSIPALANISVTQKVKSLIVSGPEMSVENQQALSDSIREFDNMKILEFTDDLISYINAADLIISMAGYNTICEIISLKKPAVIVPRVRPTKEQLIRAKCMNKLGFFTAIHPDLLNSDNLQKAILEKLNINQDISPLALDINFYGLTQITNLMYNLLSDKSIGKKKKIKAKNQKLYFADESKIVAEKP